MGALQLFVTVGVLGSVFGLALVTTAVIGMVLLSIVWHEADDHLHHRRDLTCPATGHAARVRLGPGNYAVVRCSRYGDQWPSCRQACLKAPRLVAIA